jgi:eukaryotic-like serine/threonine-protein kinase
MAERVVTELETFVARESDEGQPPASARSGVIPSRSERYQCLGEIGRGGMGNVYSVRDFSLLRISAMKVMAHDLASRPQEVQRFQREARITAQLDHPNIVPVHEIGSDSSGDPYFTMKRVEGRTLKDWIAELGPPPRHSEQFRLMLDAYLKVCDATAFAHSRGVIHCDIKPSNVMVGPFGQVYLMDWGLAQVLGEQFGETGDPVIRTRSAKRSGRPAGTPAFMSPEQAGCEPLDARTDVFGLGALLYTILTGEPPFPSDDTESALLQARAGVITPPADAFATVPPALRDACLRAISRDKNDRHAGVAELKQEVERSIQALPFLRTAVFSPGSTVVLEGEPGDCAYVVVSGSCIAYKRGENGKRIVLRKLSAGAVFGETAVLSGGVRTATVEAEDEVVVSIVSRDVLEQNVGLGTPFGAFVKALADRFRELDERFNGGPGEPPKP